MEEVKRQFILGEEWLYYKIYTGHKTSDAILTEVVKPLCEEMQKSGIIEKWFFIRYGDPQYHIRLRFCNKQPRKLIEAIFEFNKAIAPYVNNNLVWKVQVDTYQREVERYGTNTIDLSEYIFFQESKMIVEMLDMIEGEEGEKIRWLFCLRGIDELLDSFNYSISQKFELLDRLRLGFGQEFNINKVLSQQIHGKYRANKNAIQNVLDRSKDEKSEFLPLFELLSNKSNAIKPAVNEILEFDARGELQMSLNDLLSSYLHMLCNRLFRSKQRMHELVVNNFMSAYYRQQIMMGKSKQKEKTTV